MWESSFENSLHNVVLNQRYRMETEIGRGGMGIVYRATDLVEKRPVAVKAMLSSDSFSEKTIRFQREFRAISRLKHPNVVQVYDIGQEHHYLYFVMEYISGLNFREFFEQESNKKPFDFSERDRVRDFLYLFQQICDALQYIHSHRIIHRDLKPENMLIQVDPDSNLPMLKILDFGLVQETDYDIKLTRPGIPLGTVAYMSPEQAKGDTIDHRADLYALGVVLFELLVGKLPFEGSNPFSIIMNHSSQTPPTPSEFGIELPNGLESIIIKLLNKKPEERHQSAWELWENLENVFQDEAIPAYVEHPGERFIYAKYPIFSPTLVGREKEWEKLVPLLELHVDEGGRTMLLEGAIGSGKSRMVHELELQANLSRMPLFKAYCNAQHTGPYMPFKRLLENLSANLTIYSRFQDDNEPLQTDISALVNIITHKSDDASTKSGTVDVVQKFIALIDKCLQISPLVLVIEDVHWADRSSWVLIHALISFAETRPLGLLLSYRHDELELTPEIQQLLDAPPAHAIRNRLQLLDSNQIGRMISSMLGQDLTGQTGLVHRIFQQTEGNPFFVEELVKALVDRGRLYRSQQQWKLALTDPSKMTIPLSVHDAISQRLYKLEGRDDELLKFASIIGTTFSYYALKVLSQWSDDDLLDTLDALLKNYLIVEKEGGRYYQFSHSMIQTVVHERLEQAWKKEQHQRQAHLLEATLHLDSSSYQLLLLGSISIQESNLLGFHYLHAENAERALYFYLHSVHICWQYHLFIDLPDYYEISREVAKEITLAETDFQLQVLWKLVQLEVHYGNNAYKEVLELSQQMTPAELEDFPFYQKMYWYHIVGMAKFSSGDHNGALTDFEHILKLAEESEYLNEMRYTLLVTRSNIATILSAKGRTSDAIDQYMDILMDAEKFDLKPNSLVPVYINLGKAYLSLGKLDFALKHMQLALKTMGDVETKEVAQLTYQMAMVSARQGQLNKAVQYAEKSENIYNTILYKPGLLISRKFKAEVLFEQGKLAECSRIQRSLQEQVEEGYPVDLKMMVHGDVLRSAIQQFDFEIVENTLLHLEDLCQIQQGTVSHRNALLIASEYDRYRGYFDRALQYLGEIETNFSDDIVAMSTGELNLGRAKIAFLQGDYSTSYCFAEKAVIAFEGNHLYDYLEGLFFKYLLKGLLQPEFDLRTAVSDVVNRLTEISGYLRLAMMLDLILTNDELIELLTPDYVHQLMWDLQEEIDTSRFANLNWQITLFDAKYLRSGDATRETKMNEAIQLIIRIAQKIDTNEIRSSFLQMPHIQRAFFQLRALKLKLNAGLDFRRVEFFLKANSALPDSWD